MLLRALAICCLTGLLMGLSSARAAMAPSPIVFSDVRLAAGGCGIGSFRDAAGACFDTLDRNRRCPAGYFALTFPNGNHYRCAPNAWLDSRGWLMDLFGG